MNRLVKPSRRIAVFGFISLMILQLLAVGLVGVGTSHAMEPAEWQSEDTIIFNGQVWVDTNTGDSTRQYRLAGNGGSSVCEDYIEVTSQTTPLPSTATFVDQTRRPGNSRACNDDLLVETELVMSNTNLADGTEIVNNIPVTGTATLDPWTRISFNGDYYYDRTPSDPRQNYERSSDPDSCADEIDISNPDELATEDLIARGNLVATLRTRVEANGNQRCTTVTTTALSIDVPNPDTVTSDFYWIDSATIRGTGGIDFSLVNPGTFSRQPSSPCTDTLEGDSLTSKQFIERTFIEGSRQRTSGPGGTTTASTEDQCNVDSSTTVQIALSENASLQPGTNAGAGGTAADPTVNTGDVSTDVNCDAGFFSWFVCPFIEGALGFIDWVRISIIEPFLRVPAVSFEDSDNNPQFQVWQSMRNIAYGLLAPIFLIMIIAQMSSVQIMDAYTVRRTLPRLVISTIGIGLSIYVCAFLIDFFNVLGAGIDNLVADVFSGQGAFDISLGNGGGALAALSTIVGLGGAGLAVIVAPGPVFAFLALFVLLPSILAVFVVFLTLIFRQVLIVLLVVSAPFAFLLWVLPSTERYFQAWLDLFMKALLMYPLIILLLSSGGIAASIITATNTGPLGTIVTIFAILIPLLAIPASFRFAGAAIAGAGGALGRLSGGAKNAVQGDRANPNSLRNKVMGRFGQEKNSFLRGQSGTNLQRKTYDLLSGQSKNRRLGGGVRRSLFGYVQGFADPTFNQAGKNEAAKRLLQTITNNENDDHVAAGFFGGIKKFPNRGRKEFDPESDAKVFAESKEWDGRDVANFAAAAQYFAGKAQTKEDYDDIYRAIEANENLSREEKDGIHVGTGFAVKSQAMAWHHSDRLGDGVDVDAANIEGVSDSTLSHFIGKGKISDFLEETSNIEGYKLASQRRSTFDTLADMSRIVNNDSSGLENVEGAEAAVAASHREYRYEQAAKAEAAAREKNRTYGFDLDAYKQYKETGDVAYYQDESNWNENLTNEVDRRKQLDQQRLANIADTISYPDYGAGRQQGAQGADPGDDGPAQSARTSTNAESSIGAAAFLRVQNNHKHHASNPRQILQDPNNGNGNGGNNGNGGTGA